MTATPFISIVMPIYNEARYIEHCIDSLLLQDYPLDHMEWIFVDGGSTDATRDLIQPYMHRYPDLIRLLDNPHRTVPYAMNIGIAAAKGTYIIRLDAHADYDRDYIAKCVHYLNVTDADNVGGLAETKSRGFVGGCIARMLSSKFGVGNSQFRTQGKSGYVDTVPFGAFRREVFEKWGGYDERLTRNQDNEMNDRIRKNGGRIYLADDIHFSYYCRDSVKGIVDMAVKNGMWNVITMKLCPGTMGVRHFVPLAFLLSLVVLLIAGLIVPPVLYLLLAEVVLYLILNVYFSVKAASGVRAVLMLMVLFPTFHLTYGWGSVKGLFKWFCSKEFK